MKKIGTILLAAILVLSFAACAGGHQSEASVVTESESGQPAKIENVQLGETGNMQPANTGSVQSGEAAEVQSGETAEGTATEPGQEPQGSKILVAYFSATNNTEGVAQKLADGLGADIYEITPEQPYTDEDLNYGSSQSRTSAEMNDPAARPAIAGSVENMEQYDVVFLGYPIWRSFQGYQRKAA